MSDRDRVRAALVEDIRAFAAFERLMDQLDRYRKADEWWAERQGRLEQYLAKLQLEFVRGGRDG